MNNLLTALMTKITTGPSALYSDVDGRIYLDDVPIGEQPPTFPYIVFFIVAGNPDNVFAKKGRSVLIQFSLFSASEGKAEITTMYADLHSLFDECTLTVTSNTFIDMHETNLTTMVDDITVNNAAQKVKHWAVDYEVTTQES